MTAEQDSLDPAKVQAEHAQMHTAFGQPMHWCAPCDSLWPCLPYRLAALALRAREDADEYDQILIRCSELLTGVANALNGPPPPLTTWSHHDLPEKAQALAALALDLQGKVARVEAEARWLASGPTANIDTLTRAVAASRISAALADPQKGTHADN